MAQPKKTQKTMPRRREEFTYRGYRIDELKAMGMCELLPLMPARARRKIVRGFSRGEEILLTKVREGDEKIRTHLREMIVMPEMIGKSIEIYNGKEFMKVEFQPESVFHYLGEFALTRKEYLTVVPVSVRHEEASTFR